MSAADWDLLDQQNPPWKPKRDMVVTDGQKLTLGDTTLTMYLTPGHTPGTVSIDLPGVDDGQRHIAAAWGGTRVQFGPNQARLQAYAASAERFRDIVTKAGADVHPVESHRSTTARKTKMPALRDAQAGRAASVRRSAPMRCSAIVTVADECAKAAIAGCRSERACSVDSRKLGT